MHHSIYRVLRLPRFLAPQAPYPPEGPYPCSRHFTRPEGLICAKAPFSPQAPPTSPSPAQPQVLRPIGAGGTRPCWRQRCGPSPR